MVFDHDRRSNDSISDIDIHRYLLIIAYISISIDELPDYHLFVLLLEMFILFLVIVANDSVVAVSIIISQQV